ncbi:MAG: polysaccharide deacetylase family protein [Calditrichia bacterium]
MIAHRYLAKLLYAPFPQLIWRGSDKQSIYLTFDDGPFDSITSQVLDILNRYNVPATFFLSGDALEKCSDLPDYSGHAVGNHLYTHRPQFGFNSDLLREEICKTSQLISERLDRTPSLCRPPYGVFSARYQKALQDTQQQLVLWTLMANDFKWPAERVLKHLKKQTRPGDILVFHDSLKAAECIIDVLPQFIEFCQARGWRFGLIE